VERASVPAIASASPPASASPSFWTYRRRLPHWRLRGATYFVTWRLKSGLSELTSAERDIVAAALHHFDGQRYRLRAYVVMNDHVHVLVEPKEGFELTNILHSWKSFTANQLQRKCGRHGAVWQDESFDRIVRDEDEFWEKRTYIYNNPWKRWPQLKEYRWVSLCQGEGEEGDAGTEARSTEARSTEARSTSGAGLRARHVNSEEAELHTRISEAARLLNEQRERWLNPPEWIEPIARQVDAEDSFEDVPADARPLIRQSAIMARAAKDARLKKRTLTNLYNERPTWLKLAHEKLDQAVLAAYAAMDPAGGWDETWAQVWKETGAGQPLPAGDPLHARRAEVDQLVLANLLRMNHERAGK